MSASRSLPVRRVRVDPAGAHYASAFAVPATGLPHLLPVDWARAVFEKAPAVLRRCLYGGWRGGLGLRLGPRVSAQHVLGWLVTESGPDAVTLEAHSPLLTARNMVRLDHSSLTWSTFVHFKNPVGRAVWASAAPLHHQAIPLLLRRAIRKAA
ncbi:DUF2867 domain-containing protein [Streptomyces albofaciens JCM 4342]|uniref:DUF2867 domain-containing protein n=1 Tax=Streptomyces albofaciens TaxID=66866 RepID=UPI001239AC6D|nr:DUF2867 domain-containing protein [Streptomyces albofaciens]KAA6212069.1 DUF2867 domain-containing protein [Streptomyces albofaciens JCM 4342]